MRTVFPVESNWHLIVSSYEGKNNLALWLPFIKTLIPFMRASPWCLNYFPKAPFSNAIIFRVRVSTYNIWGRHRHSVYNSLEQAIRDCPYVCKCGSSLQPPLPSENCVLCIFLFFLHSSKCLFLLKVIILGELSWLCHFVFPFPLSSQ